MFILITELLSAVTVWIVALFPIPLESTGLYLTRGQLKVHMFVSDTWTIKSTHVDNLYLDLMRSLVWMKVQLYRFPIITLCTVRSNFWELFVTFHSSVPSRQPVCNDIRTDLLLQVSRNCLALPEWIYLGNIPLRCGDLT